MILAALPLALAAWLAVDLARTLHTAGHALLTRECPDRWADQSARIICAPAINMLTPTSSWR